MEYWSDEAHYCNTPILHYSTSSLLRINQNPVVHQDDQVVFAVTAYVCNQRFTWFGQVAASAAEGPFLKDLPPTGWGQLMRRLERHDVEIVLGGFQKDQL